MAQYLRLSKFTKNAEILLSEVTCQNDAGCFLRSKGLIHKEFVLADETTNAEYYKGIMDRLLKQIARICPDFHASNNSVLLLSNTLARNKTFICQFWAKKMVRFFTLSPIFARSVFVDYFYYTSISSLLLGAPFLYIFSILVVLSQSSLCYYDVCAMLPQVEVTRGW